MSIDVMIDQARRLGLIAPEEEENARVNLPLVLFCPLPAEVPTDGVFTYAVVDSLASLVQAVPGVVHMADEEHLPLVAAFADKASAFGYEAVTILGVPTADYSQDYADATFRCTKWSYSGVVAELNEHNEIDRVRGAMLEPSVHERERSQYVRGDGSVRYHTDATLGVHGDDGEEEA